MLCRGREGLRLRVKTGADAPGFLVIEDAVEPGGGNVHFSAEFIDEYADPRGGGDARRVEQIGDPVAEKGG